MSYQRKIKFRNKLNAVLLSFLISFSVLYGLIPFMAQESYKNIDHLPKDYNFSTQSDRETSDVQVPMIKVMSTNDSFHDPIYINGNTDLINQAFEEKWLGDGTHFNPYQIDGLKIKQKKNLITIENTNLYFEISNCLLIGGIKGVYLRNVSHGVIFNNIIQNVSSNGIHSYFSRNIICEKNNISSSKANGIQITTSEYIRISDNDIRDCLSGISLSNSTNTNLSSNELSNNTEKGLSLLYSEKNTIIDNHLINNGIFINGSELRHFFQTDVKNNMINGKPLVYWINKTDEVVPANAGQIILINCTSVTITNQALTKATIGILATFCDSLVIKNNILSNNGEYGVILIHSNGCVISRNILKDNSRTGLCLIYSNNNTVYNNSISDSQYGMLLSYSNKCEVKYNFIFNNENGIEISFSYNIMISLNSIYFNDESGFSLLHSEENTIIDNHLINNGIFINGSELGHFFQTDVKNNMVNGKPLIYWANKTDEVVPANAGQIILINCTSVTITNHSLVEATIGVLLAFCSNSFIHFNSFSSNNLAGLYLYNSTNNTIFKNSIEDNTVGIGLYNSGNNLIINNTLLYNGLLLSGNETRHFLQTEIINNTINGKSLIYWRNISNKIISRNVSQVLLINCSFIEIKDLDISHIPIGIFAMFCSNLTIQKNRLHKNNEGIRLIDTVNCTISSNFIFKNEEGVVFQNSHNNNISKNSISHNHFSGCFLSESTTNTITTNSFYNNSDLGINLDFSNYNRIIENIISQNKKYGINLRFSANNTINSNNFIFNNLDNDSQANDQDNWGVLNHFSYNYWNDWNISDDNNDGILDQPYYIHGSSNNSDSYPLYRSNSIEIYLLSPPTLRYPSGREILHGDILIEWDASVSYMNQNISYTVYYTNTYSELPLNLLASNLTNNSYVWDSRLVPDTASYKIVVVASNGEGLISIDVTNNYFTIQNGPSPYKGLTLLKILIIINISLVFALVFTLTYPYFRKLYRHKIKNYSLRDLLVSNLKTTFTNTILKNKWIFLALLVAIFLSVLRAWLIDYKLVVNDGYDNYAIGLKDLLSDWSSRIDIVPIPKNRFRIVYPLLVATLSSILPFSIDIITIGRIISLISFLTSVYYFSKILDNFGTFGDKKNKEKVLIIFILNPTIITNLIRFETDMLFLALSLYIIHNYLIFSNSKLTNLRKISLGSALILLIFTREVGVILLGAVIFHYFFSIPRKIKYLVSFLVFVLTIIGLWLNIIQYFLFHALWTSAGYRFANEIVYNYNFMVFFDFILNKVFDNYIFLKTLESLIYAFLPAGIFCLLGLIRLFIIEDNSSRKKVISNIITVYFLFFISFYIFLKSGRGLDRFWIPILSFPLILLPFTVDIKDLINRFFIVTKYFYKTKIVKTENISLEYDTSVFPISNGPGEIIKYILDLNGSTNTIFHENTFYFVVISQLCIFTTRIVLSLISTGVLPVYK